MSSTNTTILAIETSCDETGLALLQQRGQTIEVLDQSLASQVDIHQATGGIVPEVAAREHVTIIQPMLKQLLINNGLKSNNIDAIAVTVGPGLMPALSIGVTTAQTLAYAWQKPIVPVHHLEGHIYSALLAEASNAKLPITNFPRCERGPARWRWQLSNNDHLFPALALIVSGGHTMLIQMTDHLQYKILGSTRDDAVGEAFDKVARMLGLGYPGGPEISTAAEQGSSTAYKFARPMLRSNDLDFSFSGLKTEVLYKWRDLDQTPKTLHDIAASFQQAAVDSLTAKTEQAIEQTSPHLLLLAGGVAANQLLRQAMQQLANQKQLTLQISPLEQCGDNALMIGLAAMFAYQAGRISPWSEVDSQARVNIESFNSKH